MIPPNPTHAPAAGTIPATTTTKKGLPMSRNDEIDHYDHVARSAARLKAQGGVDPMIARLDALDRRKAAEAAAQKAKTLANLKNMTGEEIAAILPPDRRKIVAEALGVTAKPAASTAAPKAAKPKASGPSDDFRAGFNGGLKVERMRISHVYQAAKGTGMEAEALKMLAETEMDMIAIEKKLDAKASRSLVDAMKARHGLGGAA